MTRALVSGLIAALFLACYMPPPVVKGDRIPFPSDEYAALPNIDSGKNIVSGQAFLRTRGGDVKMAAGSRVILNPVTSYSQDWYQRFYLGGVNLGEPDSRLNTYYKSTVADANGRLTFKRVPAGLYYVTTVVTWESATGYQGSLEVQGGTVCQRVTVFEGDTLDVIVTR